MSTHRLAQLESALVDLRRDLGRARVRIRRLESLTAAATGHGPRTGTPIDHDGWDADGRPTPAGRDR